jgi:hypothetical protein
MGTIARSLALIAAVLSTTGLVNPYAEPMSTPIVGLVYLTAVIVFTRSFFLGIYDCGDHLRVVTWLRSLRVPRSDIEAVLRQPYYGLITGGVGGNNMFSSRVQMLGLRIRGKDRVFTGTASPNRTLRATAQAIADDLAVPVLSLAG